MTLFHDSGWYRPNEYNDGATYQNAQFPKPRRFQETAHDQLRSGAKSGHRCQMLMAPTGAGKTFLGLRACAEALQKGRRAIFVCDRNTLINQTSERADEYGLAAHGVFQADHWRSNPAMPFQIASAQTLARREWPAADLIVVDEAHTQLKAWTEHIQNTNAHVIGLSATPFSRGLGKLFSNLINAATMRELTDTGILVPMRPFVCSRADMRDAETKGGEWTEKAAQDRGMEIIGDVVSEWFEHANDRKTIVFGPTIAYCEELSARFNAIEPGIAAVFTSYTTPPQRKELLKEYGDPDARLQILISVEALAKGFDVPDVSCIVDCRPLRKSLSTAIQMWGRGLRCSPDTGKRDCLLLDHTGNILRFAQDYSDIFENGLDCLDAGKKLDRVIRDEKDEEKGDKKCPLCSAIPFVGKCMACGFIAVQKSLIEAIPGRMKEITLGPSKTGFTRRQIYEQACAYARAHSAPEKQSGRAAHIYKDIVGNWPPNQWRFDETPSAAISREVHNKITSRAIAFSKARRYA